MSQSEERIKSTSQQLDQRINEVRSAQTAKFVEIDINNWSAIHVKSMNECTALYSAATPLREWGYQWWLKVEKALDGRIGLYLCCGNDETAATINEEAPMTIVSSSTSSSSIPTPTINTATSRWPIRVDYQLMSRKRNADDAVCCSVISCHFF